MKRSRAELFKFNRKYRVSPTELYYIWRKHANLSLVKQLKPKTWRIFDEFDVILHHIHAWQRLMLVTASQAQFCAGGSFHTLLDLFE